MQGPQREIQDRFGSSRASGKHYCLGCGTRRTEQRWSVLKVVNDEVRVGNLPCLLELEAERFKEAYLDRWDLGWICSACVSRNQKVTLRGIVARPAGRAYCACRISCRAASVLSLSQALLSPCQWLPSSRWATAIYV